MDDIINVSGHRIGTAEVESALVSHPGCAEAAAVGYEHPIKGLGIYAYVTPVAGTKFTDAFQKELREYASLNQSTKAEPVAIECVEVLMLGLCYAVQCGAWIDLLKKQFF